MFRILLASPALGLAAACSTTPAPEPVSAEAFVAATPAEEVYERSVEIVETPVALPLPGQLKPIGLHARTGDDGAIGQSPESQEADPAGTIAEGRESALIEPSVDGYVNAVQVYPYTEGALYRLYASPGQVSDIALQPGEALVSVSAGDTVRWVVGDTQSGSGAKSRAHVLVKPISAGIGTNLMIATDRRTYHLELESVDAGYMAALSWRYPADEIARLTVRNELAIEREAASIESGLALENLNFDYSLSGDSPDWKPVRVFDDGRQVFIQMPDRITTTDMPPLFVLGAKGEAELVNYRVRGSYYIVDRLFRAAELRLGEKDQTVVRIARTERRTGLAALFGG
ncbi:P-type conjugative transfer protein TrbG [Henriciella sp.]|jgi:type IV secretion system protein VirB9|uniref:P-type conjugative transfer protein TrbG n=1 Tax=Henriciella sp. TaxID=1968823 RepID=UPI000C35E0AD|nr:P-type conjugative transfer protein TrbG [Henriciella sp.]MAN73658.1 P-type conjugative transfer protein TrbG [Henriciella sp.]|tara:strand:+ start:6153 stop:7181 length:1029 start_codon:yes stop_codon:yes gene_type:complete